MSKEMTYDEYMELVHNGITTQAGNCPVTPLLEMLQGRWKFQIIYELCIKSPIRFGELKKGTGRHYEYNADFLAAGIGTGRFG